MIDAKLAQPSKSDKFSITFGNTKTHRRLNVVNLSLSRHQLVTTASALTSCQDSLNSRHIAKHGANSPPFIPILSLIC